MNNLQYPLNFRFKITTLSNDFVAKDATGRTFAFVRQKMFKLKEEVQVFSDESRTSILFTLKANKWLDFSATYTIKDANGHEIGAVARKGMASLWKAKYKLLDANKQGKFQIDEENGWIKVFDSLAGEIPIVGGFTGYFLNPAYVVKDKSDQLIIRLKKQPSFFGRKFSVEKFHNFTEAETEEELILLGLMMMILLERDRG